MTISQDGERTQLQPLPLQSGAMPDPERAAGCGMGRGRQVEPFLAMDAGCRNPKGDTHFAKSRFRHACSISMTAGKIVVEGNIRLPNRFSVCSNRSREKDWAKRDCRLLS